MKEFLKGFSNNPLRQATAILLMASILLHLGLVVIKIMKGDIQQVMISSGLILIMVGALLGMHQAAGSIKENPTKTNSE